MSFRRPTLPHFMTSVRPSNPEYQGLVWVNWLDRELPNPEDQREYARERVRVVVTEALAEAMEHAKLRRVDLAERLGVTKAQITQILSGKRNMTLKTLGDVLWACGLELEDLSLGRLGQMPCTPEQTWEWSRSAFKATSAPAAAHLTEAIAHDTNPLMHALCDVPPEPTPDEDAPANADLSLAA